MNHSKTKTRFTVAYNGDVDLIPKLAQYDEVENIFGKLTSDMLGGGRPSLMLAKMNLDDLRKSITVAHQHGIEFYYLLNTVCQSNQELTREYNNSLVEFIEQLDDAGIDGVVVAVPYMLDLMKKRFPRIKVSISTFALTTSQTKAKMWEDRGADRIMINQDTNRNFHVLSKIREAVSCELELFATNMCLNQCPFPAGHMPANCHASCSGDKNKGFYLDYYSSNCTFRRVSDPVEFIKGRFIRPEDIQDYVDIGYDVFKLSGRSKGSEWLERMVRAYAERRYDGNLADLITYPFLFSEGDGFIIDPIQWLVKPKHINISVLEKIGDVVDTRGMVHIDNRKLDGFLEFFKKYDCENAICGVDCHYCEHVAKQVVSIDEDKAKPWRAKFTEIFDMLADGRAFKKNNLAIGWVARMVGLFQKLKPKKNNFLTELPVVDVMPNDSNGEPEANGPGFADSTEETKVYSEPDVRDHTEKGVGTSVPTPL